MARCPVTVGGAAELLPLTNPVPAVVQDPVRLLLPDGPASQCSLHGSQGESRSATALHRRLQFAEAWETPCPPVAKGAAYLEFSQVLSPSPVSGPRWCWWYRSS